MNERLNQLFEKYFDKTATDEEILELSSLVTHSDNDSAAIQALSEVWNRYHSEGRVLSEEKNDQILNQILGNRKSATVQSFQWKRYTAAAAIVLGITATIWLVTQQKSAKDRQVEPKTIVQEIQAPKSTHAILTLAGGRKIILDSVLNGSLAMQGQTSIIKRSDGEIAYSGNDASNQVMYNTLEVPKGSRIASITLSDGTTVWLNSGSSITYPVVFLEADRRVEITGEAYFEVAKMSGKKFFVTGHEITTEVLGTHFNVNVYDDEPEMRISLLEGSIRVVYKKDQVKVLKPGEQERVKKNGNVEVKSGVDTSAVVSWKKGIFLMDNTDISVIMRQISRWYNVEIAYKNGFPRGGISGDIPRDMDLSEVLKVMELSGVHFTIDNGKIIVSP